MSEPHPVPHSPTLILHGQWGSWEPPPRQLLCSRYNGCLFYAEEYRWPGFSCLQCRAYERMSGYEERRDLYGIADLYEMVMSPETSRTPRPTEAEQIEQEDET